MTRWFRAAIAVVLVATGFLAQPRGALAAVGPYTLEVTTPSSVQAGVPFQVTAKANNGGDAVSAWSISIGLPDGGTAQIISPAPFTSGQSYAKVFRAGDRVYSFSLGQEIAAIYPLAELYRQQSWPSGADRSLTVKITSLASVTAARIYVRVTAVDPLGTIVSFPQTSTIVDQQGLPVLLRTIPATSRTATPGKSTGTPKPSTSATSTPSPTLLPSSTVTPFSTVTPTRSPTATLTPPPTATPTVLPIVAIASPAQPTPPRPTPTLPTGVAGQNETLNIGLTLVGILVVGALVTLFAIWSSRRKPISSEAGVERVEGAGPPPWTPDAPDGARRHGREETIATGGTSVTAVRVGTATDSFQSFPVGLLPRGEARHGGTADVYRAYQPSLDRDIALKILKSWLAADIGLAARFKEAARRMARLNHPNIITVYDVGEIVGTPYVSMRWVDGPSLAELVAQQGALPNRRALTILDQIARALDYAHAQQLVHGDVKPSNVLLEDDRVTVTDFGIARVLGADGSARGGTSLGAPDYISPEQARGEEPIPSSDIYSLGVIAYELVVGRRPFNAANPLALIYAHAYSQPPPPDQVNPSLPPEAAPVLLRALAKDPSQRFASAGEFVAALRAAMGL